MRTRSSVVSGVERSNDGWSALWQDPNWTSPFCALSADAGIVTAMTRDGAIVEGRKRTTRTKRTLTDGFFGPLAA